MTDHDDAYIASAFVSWHTTPSDDGSYVPMTEEGATKRFFDWLTEVRAEAWDEGAAALGDSFWSGDAGVAGPNPYRLETNRAGE